MKVLITGGAGFIGSHLCKMFLGHAATVICIDNFITGHRKNVSDFISHPKFTLFEHDAIKKFTPSQTKLIGKPDLIIHLASPASPQHYLQWDLETALVNSEGTKNFLNMALSNQSRFVLASTSEIYGNPSVNPQPEAYWGNVNPLGPRSCYDEGKRFAEMLTMLYHRKYDLDVRIARIFNTYGPGMRMDDGRVISNFIIQALTGEDLSIYGSGRQTRSFCFISDTVAGLYLLSVKDELAGTVVNLGNPHEKTIRAIAESIVSLCKSSSKLCFSSLPEDDPEKRCPNIIKARHVLSWYPQVSLTDGLVKTISYFQKKINRNITK